MDVTIHPIFPPIRDRRYAAAAVQQSGEAVEIEQTWNCSTRRTNPDPVRTKVPVQSFVSFFNALHPGLYGTKRREFDLALKRLFYNRVVERDPRDHKAALKSGLGTYQLKIPFDRLVFPTFENDRVTVLSAVKYEYFRVKWKSMRPQYWVVLALPVGHEHLIQIEQHCDENRRLYDLEMDEDGATGVLQPKRYTPKTPKARQLRGLTKRGLAEKIDKEIEELKKRKERLLKEAAELEGQ